MKYRERRYQSLTLVLALALSWAPPALSQAKSQQLQQQATTLRTQARLEQAQAVQQARAAGLPVRLVRPDRSLVELQRFENGTPIYYVTQNETAAQTTSAHEVHPNGSQGFSLTGAGVDVGIWDGGGVYVEHQEFEGRATQEDSEQSAAHHATHVAGTMVATGAAPSARGMAYEASLQAYNWTFDTSEMANAAASGLRLSNHSYGAVTGWVKGLFGDGKWVWLGNPDVSQEEDYRFGFYNTTAQNWDEIAHNAPNYLIVKAAGNDRNDAPGDANEHWHRDPETGEYVLASDDLHEDDGGSHGYDSIIDAGVAKNVLTVGAVQDVAGGYTGPGDVTMTSFSAWGPTDDGRIKPDVVANGTTLYSPVAASGGYGTKSGTSMSAPNAAGSIALLLEHQQNLYGSTSLRASTLKALLLHTADEPDTQPGPDYRHGWGLINTLRAAQVMRQNAEADSALHIQERTLTENELLSVEVQSEGTEPLQATIAWTDPAGTPPGSALDPTTPMLVNDLDLRIIGPDGTTYQPWTLDPSDPSAPATPGDNVRDNAEQVHIAAPTPGTYTIQITHKGTLDGGPQPVSLITTGNAPPTTPLAVSPTLFLQGPFQDGQMSTALNAAGYLPTTQPYADSIFIDTPLHYAGSEEVPTGFFDNHPDVVDWVLIELRSALTTPVATQAALLTSDGSIVNLDGTSPVTFSDLEAGDYYVVVRHRNHLPVMSADPVSLDGSSTSYDFTSSPNAAYGNSPVKELEAGIYGAWSGNVSPDGQLKYGGPQNDRLPILNNIGNILTGTYAGYSQADVNMDGEARYGGPQNDRLPILNNIGNVLTGTRSASVPEQ